MKKRKEDNMIFADNSMDTIKIKKSGIIKQKQKGLYAMRLKTVGGDLTAAQLREIARVAEKYARGEVHLTTRQGVEIHNMNEEVLEKAGEELKKGGIEMGACGLRVRGIVACPGNVTCRRGIINTKRIGKKLDIKYFKKELPSKFKIAVTGCPHNCAKATENDIGIMGGIAPEWNEKTCTRCDICVKLCPANAIYKENEQYIIHEKKCIHCSICTSSCPVSGWKPRVKGFSLFIGGTMGKSPRLGIQVPELIESEERLMELIERLIEYYKKHGKKKERSGHMIERIGEKEVIKEIMDGD